MNYNGILQGIQTPQSGYYMADGTRTMPAVAVSSPANTALGVQGGQYGGQGMAMPAGASTGGMGGANILSGLVSSIGDAASQYVKASSIIPGVATPEYDQQLIQPALANFPLAPVGQQKPVITA